MAVGTVTGFVAQKGIKFPIVGLTVIVGSRLGQRNWDGLNITPIRRFIIIILLFSVRVTFRWRSVAQLCCTQQVWIPIV